MPKILIIEDEPSILFVLEEFLKDQGYDITAARIGEEGLREIEEGLLPDLAIVDLNLPGIKGKDVIMAIHFYEHLEHLPVIIITGAVYNPDEFPPKSSYKVLIEKPFGLWHMLEKIHELINPN